MINICDVDVDVQQCGLVKRTFEDIADARASESRGRRHGPVVMGAPAGGFDERDRQWAELRSELLKTLMLFPDALDAVMVRLRELRALDEAGEQ